MPIVYVPRSLGSALILTIVPPVPPATNAVCLVRSGSAALHVRCGKAIAEVRSGQAIVKVREP